MATVAISVRKKKSPKKPNMKAPKSSWDRYEKKKKEVDAHNKRAEAELARRKRIASK